MLKGPDGQVLAGQDGTLPFYIKGFEGEGTSAEPYLIKTAADLAQLAELVNAGNTDYNDRHYKLVNNIDLSAYGEDYNDGEGWTPIGKYISDSDNSKAFRGKFNGNGKVITGLYINRNSQHYQGLFGYANDVGVLIENVSLTNVNIRGSGRVGGVVGDVKGTVQNCYITGSVSGTSSYVGGVAGMVSGSTVQNCYSTGSVSSNGSAGMVGGVVGLLNGGSVQNCYSSSSVEGNQSAGGVVGSSLNSTVQNCYSTGSVNGSAGTVGGVVGILNGGSVQNCVALNSSVKLTGSGIAIGRVVGYTQGAATLSHNYAFSGIPDTWNNKGLAEKDGADVTASTLFKQEFWTTPENWSVGAWDNSIWTFAVNELPVLTGLAGQNGDGGLHLLIRNIQYATVNVNGTYTYTGSPITPDLTVTFDCKPLVKDTDYTVAITSIDESTTIDESTITSAGTNAGVVTLTLTGQGNYTGSKNITYTIEPKALTEAMITVEGDPFTYDGTAQEPEITVQDGTTTLAAGTNYENVTYDNNINAGTATVSISGKGNYSGTVSKDFTIAPAVLTISGGTVAAKTYDGSLSADITSVTFDGLQNSETLELGTDYTVTGAEFDDANAGDGKTVTGTVALLSSGDTASAKAKNYSLTDGTLTLVNQTIAKRPVTVKADNQTMTAGGSLPEFTYTVEGVLTGEAALVGIPSLRLSTSANTRVAGSYDIEVDLTGVSYTDNYTAAAPAYINGTLTVSASSSGGGGGGSSSGGNSSQETTQTTPVTGQAIDATTGEVLQGITAQVGKAADGTAIVQVKSQEAVVFKQQDGTPSSFGDASKLTFIATDKDTKISMGADGTIEISNLAQNTQPRFVIQLDLGNNQKITIGYMEVKVDASGNVTGVSSTLIDPYGTIIDAATGEKIVGAHVTLYYADTERNKQKGIVAHTPVDLPLLNDFKPNNNKNPQMSDQTGAYAFMVYPHTDYYLVATKDGYETYKSMTISVEQEIVKWNFKMTKPLTGVQRLAGDNRVDTALAIAKASHTAKLQNVVLTTANNYPDALAGSVLAYKLNAPILLINNSASDQNKVIDYLKSNLNPAGTITILGGTGAVGQEVESKLKGAGFTKITRLSGSNRSETALKIAEQIQVPTGRPIILVNEGSYADALSISSSAAAGEMPILLVGKDNISDAVRQKIAEIKPIRVYLVGGEGVLSAQVESQVAELTGLTPDKIIRLGGADRYATSLAVAKHFNLPGQSVSLATGENFPDALAGGVFAANYNAPIFLVKDALRTDSLSYLKTKTLLGGVLLGGEGVLSKSIEQELTQLLQSK